VYRYRRPLFTAGPAPDVEQGHSKMIWYPGTLNSYSRHSFSSVDCTPPAETRKLGTVYQIVTHILGVRAFGTQLLCEQVVGRGRRRCSVAVQCQSCWHRT